MFNSRDSVPYNRLATDEESGLTTGTRGELKKGRSGCRLTICILITIAVVAFIVVISLPGRKNKENLFHKYGSGLFNSLPHLATSTNETAGKLHSSHMTHPGITYIPHLPGGHGAFGVRSSVSHTGSTPSHSTHPFGSLPGLHHTTTPKTSTLNSSHYFINFTSPKPPLSGIHHLAMLLNFTHNSSTATPPVGKSTTSMNPHHSPGHLSTTHNPLHLFNLTGRPGHTTPSWLHQTNGHHTVNFNPLLRLGSTTHPSHVGKHNLPSVGPHMPVYVTPNHHQSLLHGTTGQNNQLHYAQSQIHQSPMRAYWTVMCLAVICFCLFVLFITCFITKKKAYNRNRRDLMEASELI